MDNIEHLTDILKQARVKHDRARVENMVKVAMLAHTGLFMRELHRKGQTLFVLVAPDGSFDGKTWRLSEIEVALQRAGICPRKK